MAKEISALYLVFLLSGMVGCNQNNASVNNAALGAIRNQGPQSDCWIYAESNVLNSTLKRAYYRQQQGLDPFSFELADKRSTYIDYYNQLAYKNELQPTGEIEAVAQAAIQNKLLKQISVNGMSYRIFVNRFQQALNTSSATVATGGSAIQYNKYFQQGAPERDTTRDYDFMAKFVNLVVMPEADQKKYCEANPEFADTCALATRRRLDCKGSTIKDCTTMDSVDLMGKTYLLSRTPEGKLKTSAEDITSWIRDEIEAPRYIPDSLRLGASNGKFVFPAVAQAVSSPIAFGFQTTQDAMYLTYEAYSVDPDGVDFLKLWKTETGQDLPQNTDTSIDMAHFFGALTLLNVPVQFGLYNWNDDKNGSYSFIKPALNQSAYEQSEFNDGHDMTIYRIAFEPDHSPAGNPNQTLFQLVIRNQWGDSQPGVNPDLYFKDFSTIPYSTSVPQALLRRAIHPFYVLAKNSCSLIDADTRAVTAALKYVSEHDNSYQFKNAIFNNLIRFVSQCPGESTSGLLIQTVPVQSNSSESTNPSVQTQEDQQTDF